MKTSCRFLLLALLFAIVTSACSSQQQEIIPEYDGLSVDSIDFNGRSFLVAQEENDYPGSIFYYPQDSLYYDLLTDHIKKIEQQYNMKLNFSMEFGREGTFSGMLMSAAMSGLNICDFVIMRGSNNNMKAAESGTFYPLNYFPDIIDLKNSDKYGPMNILECCMAKGNIYGVIPNYWPQKSNDGNMGLLVAINENLINRYGLDDPRDYYEQNIWKLSKFDEIMPIFHIVDGENDIKSVAINTRYLCRGFLGSYKIGNVYEKDGQFYPADKNPDLLPALEWGLHFLSAYSDDYLVLEGWNYTPNLAAGECVMAFTESSYLLDMAKQLDNFGFVPFPAADKYDSKDVGLAFSTFPTFSIFTGTDDPESCARVIDILFEELEGVTQDEMVDSLYKTLFFDERDAMIYTQLYKNAVYDYFGVGGNLQQKIETVYTSKTAQEVISSIEGTLDKMFEERMLPNYMTMIEMQ
ncbi:MAG: hypothetical protein II149_01035 [Clostridia bacterium]|nr:hypothetical protein [Clostridia bacterium]